MSATEDFIMRVYAGSLSSVKYMWSIPQLQEEIDVNECDKSGNTCLAIASMRNDSKMAEFLLYTCDADTDVARYDGLTPYEIAVKYNSAEVIEVFDKYDETVAVTKDFISRIHCGYIDSLQYMWSILEDEINVNGYDDAGNTCLSIASRRNDDEVVEFLLYTCNADPNITSYNGLTPYEIAVKHNSTEVIEVFDKYKNKNKEKQKLKAD
jgi:ankyrin repeat protein